jgi:hypothetical protein
LQKVAAAGRANLQQAMLALSIRAICGTSGGDIV